MSTPLVSICIPTYNQTEFLQRTFDSIVIQTFTDFEVIVSDDSTNDEVKGLVNRFKDKCKINYIKNPVPLGSPGNWNALLDLAKGQYIKFMHHDDWFSGPDSLQQFMVAFEKVPETDFVFCASEILNIERNEVKFNKPSKHFVKALQKDPAVLFANNQIGAPSATLFKKTTHRFDTTLKWLVDIDFYTRYLQKNKAQYLPKALIVNTAGHPGQVTQASQTRETQLGEYSYYYRKIHGDQMPGAAASWFFIRLFRSYKVRSLEEVTRVRNCQLEPQWWFRLLIRISRIRFWKKQ